MHMHAKCNMPMQQVFLRLDGVPQGLAANSGVIALARVIGSQMLVYHLILCGGLLVISSSEISFDMRNTSPEIAPGDQDISPREIEEAK